MLTPARIATLLSKAVLSRFKRAADVLCFRDGFQVIRVNAVAVTASSGADVIDLQAIRDGAESLFIEVSVSPMFGGVGAIDDAISVGSETALIEPTSRLWVNDVARTPADVVTNNAPSVLALQSATPAVCVISNRSWLTAPTHAAARWIRRLIRATVHVGPERRTAGVAMNRPSIGSAITCQSLGKRGGWEYLSARMAETFHARISGHFDLQCRVPCLRSLTARGGFCFPNFTASLGELASC